MVRQALIHWVKEGRWDVWASTRLPPEHRQEGAMGMFPWDDGKSYLGKVIKISASTKEIERAEAKLCEMVKGANSGAQVLGKRASKQTVRTGRTASDNQVSKALGEKRKLNNEQAALKKQAALEKKQREQAMQDAEKEEDLSLFPVNNVKRSLFNEPLLPSMMPKTNELMSDEEQDSEDDEPFGTVDDLKLVCDEDDNLDDDEDEDGTSYEPTISDFKNPNTEHFLRFLLNAFTPAPESSTAGGSSIEAKVYAKPLQVEGQKMVRLKKCHSLMVSKASKAALLVDFKSRKSSTLFLRKTLEEIYGAEQLSRMTAMGRLKDSLGISKQDLNAIYEFVTEFSGPLSWDEFKVTINKKCSSKKSPSYKKSSSKKSSSLNKSKPTGTKQSISTSESVPGTPNKSDSDSRRTPNKHHSESLRETPDKRQRPTQEEVRVTPMKLAQKIVATPLISTDEQPKSQHSTPGSGYGRSRPFSGPHRTHHSPSMNQGPHSGQHSVPDGYFGSNTTPGPYVSQPQAARHVPHSDQHSTPGNGYGGQSRPFSGPHHTYYQHSPSMNQGPHSGQHSFPGYRGTGGSNTAPGPYVPQPQADHVPHSDQHSRHYDPYPGYQSSSSMQYGFGYGNEENHDLTVL